MKKLIALVPILYLSKLYESGEEIPAGDEKMVKAWVENKSAKWTGESPSIKEKKNIEKEEPTKESLESDKEEIKNMDEESKQQEEKTDKEQKKAPNAIKRRNK